MSRVGREDFEKKVPKDWSEKNRQRVMLAYRLAKYGHRGQVRDNGERYFEHPKRVALILIDELKEFSPAMIIAALLHDIKEDSFILNWENIKLIFGERVSRMIYALTKDKSLEKEERDKDYREKIEKATRNVKIIKLADRLDNLRTLEGCTQEKQEEYLRETKEIYLPLAQKVSAYFLKEIQEIIRQLSKHPGNLEKL